MMHDDYRVLIVEDDAQIRNFIAYTLEQNNFNFVTVSSGKGAIESLLTGRIDLMLLDLGLPDIDGTEVISKLREWSELPIIVISARDQDVEKARALDLGADDYLTKPFSTTELLARMRVALRHSNRKAKDSQSSRLHVLDLTMDLDKRLVYLKEEELHLTPMEYELLKLLFKNIGRVLTTSFIISQIWGEGYGEDTQALRALMSALRRKIEENPARPTYISTEVGIGYRLKSYEA